MKNKAISKNKTKVVGRRTRRHRGSPKKARIARPNMRTAPETAPKQEELVANPDAVQSGIVGVIEVWGVESIGTEEEVNNTADIEPTDSEESEEVELWVEP